MKRYEIINRIIKSKEYKKYLEIGVRDGKCFRKIECENKTGVDPRPSSTDTTHIMTSDYYFNSLNEEEKFDIIFIDGLHIDYQVDKDIENSLKFLSENGTIVLHDCNPPTQNHALEYPVFTRETMGEWNGTVYLSLIKIRLYRGDLILNTVDSDWGVGILTRGKSKTLDSFPDSSLNWDFFNNNRNDILDLIDTETFKSYYTN